MMPESVALSFWSPPYCLGKLYESHLNFREWATLLEQTIAAHYPVIKAGGFLGINIADILAFEDPYMPRIQADNVSAKKVKITRDEVLAHSGTIPALTSTSWLPCWGAANKPSTGG